MTVYLLTTGTVGKSDKTASVGEKITVLLHDENGTPITETGIVEEILENDESDA